MSDVVIKVEDVSKLYRLGEIGTGTISHDLNRWWASLRGKEDPFSLVGELNDRTQKSQKDEYVWALKDINFELKRGEVLGIIGKNGAGKSSLLKLLSRITAPTKGEIKIKGRVASLLEVGTGMHPEMTGIENVYLNGTILGMTRLEIKNKLEEILDFAGCLKYADTPVKRYSSGMKVRLGFAVAAFLEPEILIVDEVLAVGDLEFQSKATSKMSEISRNQNRTILFVSHNLQAIRSMCNRVIVLSNGRFGFEGDTESGLEFYLNSNENGSKNDSTINSLVNLKDEVLDLIDFQLIQEGFVGFEFVSNKQILILFKYKVKQPVIGLRIGFDLIDRNSGAIIFRAFHDDLSKKIETVSPGFYTTEMLIEPNLLKQGSYIFIVAIGIHNQRWIIFDQLKVRINVTNIGEFNRLYSDQRPGMILPNVKSSSKKNENEY